MDWMLYNSRSSVGQIIRKGYTPLHLAAEKGLVHCTKLLLKLGANPNAGVGRSKTLPLRVALEHNHIPIIQILLPITDHEAMWVCLDGPFVYPIRHSCKTSFQLLIDAGYSPTRASKEIEYCTCTLLDFIFVALRKLFISPLTELLLHGTQSVANDIFFNNTFCYSSLAPEEFPPLLAVLLKYNLSVAYHLIKNGASINIYLDESVEAFTEVFGNDSLSQYHRYMEWVICQSLCHHKIVPLPAKLQLHLSQKCLDIVSQYPVVRSLKEISKRTVLSSFLPEQIIDGLQCFKSLPNSIIDYLLHVDLTDI